MGGGNLLGALVLSAAPLTGEPDLLTTRHVALLGGCLGLCALAPSFGWAVVGFMLLGLATAPFVTATFAARNAYAPPCPARSSGALSTAAATWARPTRAPTAVGPPSTARGDRR